MNKFSLRNRSVLAAAIGAVLVFGAVSQVNAQSAQQRAEERRARQSEGKQASKPAEEYPEATRKAEAKVSPTFGYTDSYNLVNLTLGATTDRLSVTAYVENLFDDDAVTYIHPEAFLASRFARLRPRTVGLRLSYDY